MAQKQQQKVKGCRKCGRAKKKGTKTTFLSLFVRNKISAREYFQLTNQAVKSV